MNSGLMNFNLPKQYEWISKEPAPAIFREALKLYGTKETKGNASNPQILMWANEIKNYLGIEYNSDSMPWCGLFIGICAKRAFYNPPPICLRAKSWLKFGRDVDTPMFGDILVFERPQGGHVGLYIAEDETSFYVLGGNQSDKVCIVPINKDRIISARRCIWKVKQPENVRQIFIKPTGEILSTNER